jgi:SAM-dependent methyltransferase
MIPREHWDKIYSTNPIEKLGWYLPRLEISMEWIKELKLSKNANIIDVGGGASTLVDDLLNEEYRSINVVDISKKALSISRERLGVRAELVSWLEEDITSVPLAANQFDLWHDRSVFHFLTGPDKWQQYRKKMLKSLRPDGHVIIAVFAPEAPSRCSGLPVKRYSVDLLENTFGEEFELKRHDKYLHITPSGVEQSHLYCHFRKST